MKRTLILAAFALSLAACSGVTSRRPMAPSIVQGDTPPFCVFPIGSKCDEMDDRLDLGVAEARLRGAPLRVFALWRLRPSGPGDPTGPVDHRAAAVVERRVAYWRSRQPDLDIEVVSEHNGLLNYLEHLQRDAAPVQLIVVDPRRPGPLDVLLGPAARAPLQAAGATVMTCDRTSWL